MNEPLIIGLEMRHNCYCSDVPERLHDTRLRYLTYAGSTGNVSRNLMEVESDNLDRALKEIARHPVVSRVEPLRKGEKKAEVYVSSKKDEASVEALIKTGCTFFEHGIYENGVERICILCPDFKSFKRFISNMNSDFDYKLMFKKRIKASDSIRPDFFGKNSFPEIGYACSLITPRQLEVFDFACRKGYYENPKRISLREIAMEFDISEAAASELIRKVERRLLPLVSDIVKIMR